MSAGLALREDLRRELGAKAEMRPAVAMGETSPLQAELVHCRPHCSAAPGGQHSGEAWRQRQRNLGYQTDRCGQAASQRCGECGKEMTGNASAPCWCQHCKATLCSTTFREAHEPPCARRQAEGRRPRAAEQAVAAGRQHRGHEQLAINEIRTECEQLMHNKVGGLLQAERLAGKLSWALQGSPRAPPRR